MATNTYKQKTFIVIQSVSFQYSKCCLFGAEFVRITEMIIQKCI